MNERRDVIVIGGGIIGLLSAWELAGRGHGVLLVDRRATGREASWAGGGILSPINPHEYPPALEALCRESAALYPEIAERVEREAGFSVELRATGLLRVAFHGEEEALESVARSLESRGHALERIDGDRARQLEPALSPSITRALNQREIMQIRNPRFLRALAVSAAHRGVEIREHASVSSLEVSGKQVIGARIDDRLVEAGEVVLAAGAWSATLMPPQLEISLPLRPVHGVMVLLERRPPLCSRVIVGRGRYLIPRVDGRLLAGSTVEERGFDRSVPLGAVASVLEDAISMAPSISECSWQRAWSGLRPAAFDRLPFLGRPADVEGLVVATGHYRNGLLLGAITARIVAQLVAGESPGAHAEACRLDRPRFD